MGMFDMLSGESAAGAKRCKSSWETDNEDSSEKIQIISECVEEKRTYLQKKKKRKETKWGVPDEMDKNKCQILIWIARCRSMRRRAGTDNKPWKRGASAAHQKLIMWHFFSYMSLGFFYPDNISIDPQNNNKKNSRVLPVSRAACRWVTKRIEGKKWKRKKKRFWLLPAEKVFWRC